MTVSKCDLGLRSGDGPSASGDVVELTFLMLRDHLSTLERLAKAEGITVGRLLRRIISDHVARESGGHSNAGTRSGTDSTW